MWSEDLYSEVEQAREISIRDRREKHPRITFNERLIKYDYYDLTKAYQSLHLNY